MRPEGLCQRKIPVTTSGIEPATLRVVAQCLSQMRTSCPSVVTRISKFGLVFAKAIHLPGLNFFQHAFKFDFDFDYYAFKCLRVLSFYAIFIFCVSLHSIDAEVT